VSIDLLDPYNLRGDLLSEVVGDGVVSAVQMSCGPAEEGCECDC